RDRRDGPPRPDARAAGDAPHRRPRSRPALTPFTHRRSTARPAVRQDDVRGAERPGINLHGPVRPGLQVQEVAVGAVDVGGAGALLQVLPPPLRRGRAQLRHDTVGGRAVAEHARLHGSTPEPSIPGSDDGLKGYLLTAGPRPGG